jgi:hypothetical protein
MMIALADGSQIELFEYDAPDASRRHPRGDDIGATHIALKAVNVEQSIAALKARRLTILNDLVTLSDGTRWFYFLTPWGSRMELVFPPET